MDDILLEPLNAYTSVYRDKFAENTKDFFDDLIKKSAIDVEQNRRTVAEYKQEMKVVDELSSKLSAHKALKGFLIFLAVAGFIMLGVGIFLLVQNNILVGSILLPIGVVLAISMIVVTVKAVNPKIKHVEEECEKHRQCADELLTEAWKQMAPLNALFDSNATKILIEKTVPLIQIDDNFDMRRYDYLNAKYGFSENRDLNRSTIAILTGEILGNPFVVDRELVQTMGSETYTGTLVIHWTTTYTDSEGHTHTQSHSQTLVATVTKPKPVYAEQTRLIYGNEAAPDLRFTHEPSHAEQMSEKELESTVKSGAKKIQKMQDKAIKKGEKAFTGMGNEEFDVLFGALDRNNEVQFRLLFTPLAQKNMLELMKSKEGFGDDFFFGKYECLNMISSEHSRYWDLDTSYTRYQSYDVDDSFAKFASFNQKYFKALYFDLAPLLSIPLYQQHKPHEYIYKDSYYRNCTSYEAEYAVNKMGRRIFAPSLAATESILKTHFMTKDGASDQVMVTAHSFKTEDRVDLVPVWGGDGRMHSVPVHWLEYIPIEQNSTVKMKELAMSDREFGRKLNDGDFKAAIEKYGQMRVFSHGILCCLIAANDLTFDTDISKVLK